MDFDEIYNRFFKDVYLFILTMSQNPDIAEDITQETFFRALKEIKHFRETVPSNPGFARLPKTSTSTRRAGKRRPVSLMQKVSLTVQISKPSAYAKMRLSPSIRSCTILKSLTKRSSLCGFWVI